MIYSHIFAESCTIPALEEQKEVALGVLFHHCTVSYYVAAYVFHYLMQSHATLYLVAIRAFQVHVFIRKLH